MTDVVRRTDALIAEVSATVPCGESVRVLFHAVPRHLFVPPFGLACANDVGHPIDREADPAAWWDAVYSDATIVTQLDDGATELTSGRGDYTSSASAPSTVVSLLRLLNAGPGHHILEIGTGTGWTAALLSHLVGEHGSVTSIEVDAKVADQAGKNLATAGTHPQLIIGDGAHGHAGRAPYDRVHVTCGIRTVPHAWIEQSRPGAVIVLPYCPGFGDGHDEDGALYRLWLADPADPYSWGTVRWRPDAEEYEVYQVGDRPLWDEVTDAYFRWVSWGEPGRDRFGMTVTPEGQRIWLDDPERGRLP
ncbi:methyltransferase domain-containing protein [Nonomuraea purpurea]|uniref:Protein-L-isoaspartate O-methyltransferase n=1 Tax=Nonomuraea purpurea TaxID=1849276 RepID=A0ABV8GHD4_9ACTN